MNHCTCNNCVAFGPSRRGWCLLRLSEAVEEEPGTPLSELLELYNKLIGPED